MQIPSKAYLRFARLGRLIHGLIRRHDANAPAQTSAPLACTAVVLAILLAGLVIERHSAEFDSMGSARNGYLFNPVFVSP